MALAAADAKNPAAETVPAGARQSPESLEPQKPQEPFSDSQRSSTNAKPQKPQERWRANSHQGAPRGHSAEPTANIWQQGARRTTRQLLPSTGRALGPGAPPPVSRRSSRSGRRSQASSAEPPVRR